MVPIIREHSIKKTPLPRGEGTKGRTTAASSSRQIVQVSPDNMVKGFGLFLIRPVTSLRNDFELTVRHSVVEVLGIFDRRKIIFVSADGDRRGVDVVTRLIQSNMSSADPILVGHLRIGLGRQGIERIDDGLGRAFGEA